MIEDADQPDQSDDDADDVESITIDTEKPLAFTEQDEDAPNLVTLLKKSDAGLKLIRDIANLVIQRYEDSSSSTEELRKRHAENWDLFLGKIPEKTFPFEHAARAHVPIMFENLTRIQSRCFNELFGDGTNVVTVPPLGPDDEVTAEIVTKHSNWQLTEDIPDFWRQMNRGMLNFFAVGDVIGNSYYDAERRQNRHEVLTIDDIRIPYVTVSVMPDFSDVPYIIEIKPLHRHQIQSYRGTWEYVKDVLAKKPAHDDDPELLYAEKAQSAEGIKKPDTSDSAPYKLLFHTGWCDLLPPFGEEDRDRYVRAVVDYKTKHLLSLTIHEEASWKEKRRYREQMEESIAYGDAMQQHAAQQAGADEQRRVISEAVQLGTVAPEEAEMAMGELDMQLNPPPVPPEWMAEWDAASGQEMPAPAPPKKAPIYDYTHGVCIEPVVGWHGIGYGGMQASFNKGANTLLSQTIDSATLANAWGIVTASNLEFERPFSMAPGAINVAKGVSADQLKNSFIELRPGQANPQMFDLIRMITDWAQSSAQAPDVLSGESGKSGETFRGISARIEQATTQLSVPTRTFARTFLKPLLVNNARLNSIFLPDEEIVQVNNHLLGIAPETLRVGRRLYERDYNVIFTADMRFTTRAQRVAEADDVVGMASAGPMQGNMPFLQRALRKALEARGRFDMVPFLGPPLPPPETPMGLPPPPLPGEEPLPIEGEVPPGEEVPNEQQPPPAA